MSYTPHIHSLEDIVAQGLCIGCGLCESIAGSDSVRMSMNAEGGERPMVTGTVDMHSLRLINAVCPGIHCEGYVHETSIERDLNPPDVHPIWGPTRYMGTGHAGDPAIRFHASSGGALSALAAYLLDVKAVDFILHVAASRQQPARSARVLSFDTVQVMEASGSRYGPAAPLIDFKALLDRGQSFAFIGKPCDISAIRNYATLDPRVDQLLRYTLNFYCGGVSEFGKTMDYVRNSGLAEEEVAHLRYRGDGCPGQMVIRSHTGREFAFGYNEMWEDESRWQLQFRCKVCPDSVGDLADISVADVWPGGKPDTDGLGFNGFIARTLRGQRLLSAAIDAGAIKITEDLDYHGLELAQGSHQSRKQALTSRLSAMSDAGLIAPRFQNLRLNEAAAMTDDDTRRSNHNGMRERLARGENREALSKHTRGDALKSTSSNAPNLAAKSCLWLAGSLFACLLLGPRPGHAASAVSTATSDAGSLDEVVVTANKREENVRDVPVSIGVLDGDVIDSLRVQSVEDISRIIPGVSFAAHNNGPNGPGQDNITVRGVSSTVGNPTVGIYLDEVPLITITGYQGDAEPRLIDIERVEVLRGPQGTLYGASSEGGTVRFITPQPNLHDFSGRFKQDVSYTKHGSINYDDQAVLNIPVIDGVFALRVSAEYGQNSGYINNYALTGSLVEGNAAARRLDPQRRQLRYEYGGPRQGPRQYRERGQHHAVNPLPTLCRRRKFHFRNQLRSVPSIRSGADAGSRYVDPAQFDRQGGVRDSPI